jgi:hypothetical protein
MAAPASSVPGVPPVSFFIAYPLLAPGDTGLQSMLFQLAYSIGREDFSATMARAMVTEAWMPRQYFALMPGHTTFTALHTVVGQCLARPEARTVYGPIIGALCAFSYKGLPELERALRLFVRSAFSLVYDFLEGVRARTTNDEHNDTLIPGYLFSLPAGPRDPLTSLSLARDGLIAIAAAFEYIRRVMHTFQVDEMAYIQRNVVLGVTL